MTTAIRASLALVAMVGCAPLPPCGGAEAAPKRFLDYLPKGSYVELRARRDADTYDVRILTAEQVKQRPKEFAEYEKLRVEREKRDKEGTAKPEDRDRVMQERYREMLGLSSVATMVYQIVAVGEDCVEVRVEWQPTRRTRGEVRISPLGARGRFVLPLAAIHEIRLPPEGAEGKPEPEAQKPPAAKAKPKPKVNDVLSNPR